MLKKEKSEDKEKQQKADKQPLSKQKSIGLEVAPKPGDKGVRKSEKKDIRPSLSFSRYKSSSSPKSKEGLKQDDFLKATMRIFLVVSPPIGKLQIKCKN
ncbi:hypothetical protein HUJ04_002853 [Dendroctonus ponderosae]|nr:hypothetical protein HUJ04_002853 [Dendroctonus ponderosae]